MTRLCQGSGSIAAMRDYLAATRERVVVFDGSMGATLEQYDLTPADYGGLQGKCHEALILHRPDVIQALHESMIEAGAEVVQTDSFQASRLKLEEWGLGEHTLEINQRSAEIARKAVGEDKLRRRLDRPHRPPARLRRPDAGQDHLPRARRRLRGAGARARPGRRRPHHHRDRPGHPRGQGRRLRRARGVQGARALGPDPDQRLAAAQRRQDAAGHRHRRRADHARGAEGRRASASTAPPAPRTCATRSASSASTARCPCTASPTPACRCRAPTARRSSPRSPSRWPRCWASSSSASA